MPWKAIWPDALYGTIEKHIRERTPLREVTGQGRPPRASHCEGAHHLLRGSDGAACSLGQEPGHVGRCHGPARRRDRRHAVGAPLRALHAEAWSLPLLLLVPVHLGTADRGPLLHLLPAAEG